MRKMTTLAMLVALVAAGCDPSANPTISPAAPAPNAAPVAATPAPDPAPAADGAVMAMVNGKPIYMSSLYTMLVRDYGMSPALELIQQEVVIQAAAAKNVTVTDADVMAENYAVLKGAMGYMPAEKDREQLLNSLIRQIEITRGVTRPVWDMVMRRQAMLRKLCAGQAQVTEDQVKDEFAATYGQKHFVRDIQCASIQEAQAVRKELEGLKDVEALKKRFIELAINKSRGVTAPNGGLICITAKTPVSDVPSDLRDAALQLKKPGELSQIISLGTVYHVLMLDNIEEPKNVKFADVRASLIDAIKERQMGVFQKQLLEDLMTSAKKNGKIEFVNPTLKAQAVEREKAAKETKP